MEQKIHIGGIDILQPREIVCDVLKYKQKGSVLDLGAGFGRHSLFLAFKGFAVTAVEKEEDRIVRFKQQAVDLPADINIVASDVIDFTTEETFDIVLATMILHFLPENEAKAMIQKMQRWTNAGGLNVITTYIDKNPEGLRAYQFKSDELKELYRDWNMLQYEESLGDIIDAPTDGGPERRWAVRMIAQKI